MAFKSETTKQIEKEIKQEKKGNKEMKKSLVIASTVGITLATLATIAGLIYLGFTWGMSYEKSVQDRVTNEAKVLTASVAPTTEPSK